MALVFHSGFPGSNPSAEPESGQAGESIFLQQVRDLNIREMLRSGDPGSPFVPTGSIGQTPNDAAERPAEAERRIGRC